MTIFFLIAYRRRMSWWFHSRQPQERILSYALHKFAVVIPARNEGKTVIPLMQSLKNQTYASSLFDIYVIVKEPDDPTIEMIKEVLPDVTFFVDEEQQTKGHALNYGMERICKDKTKSYDGYMIIDADCILDKAFMSEMNRAFGSGKDVYNSKLVVKNYLTKNSNSNSWASRCNGLIWTLMSELGNRAKSDLGIVTMTLGTGLLIKGSLIEEWQGWPFQSTLTEDMELQRTCALNHYSCEYVSYAVCYVEESTKLSVTNTRRNRWMTGVVHCDCLYDNAIKKDMKTKQDRLNFYAIHSLYYVYFYVGFLCLILGMSAISGLFLAIFGHSLTAYFFYLSLSCFLILYFGLFVMTIRCMVVDASFMPMKLPTRIWIAVTHPLYYMGYIGIMFKIFTFRKTKQWKCIKRVEFQENVFEQV